MSFSLRVLVVAGICSLFGSYVAIAQSCDSGKGVCVNTTQETCDGILKTGYCPGPNEIICCEPVAELPERCKSGGPALLESSYEFTLENQGFSGHPGALVYVPTLFNKSSPQLELVVYIHGYYNCIRNIVRETNLNCNCSEGQDLRDSYNLIGQFEKAAKPNWLFIAAEVAFDQANDDPGKWAETGMFKNYLTELLSIHLAPIIGIRSLEEVSRVRLFSHSGGYYTIGNMATVGEVPQVLELCLLDSLYADFAQFDSFVQNHISEFGLTPTDYRFTSVFTEDGGTYSNNIAMEKRVVHWAKAAGQESTLYIDNSLSDLEDSAISSYSIIFKLSAYDHNDVPRELFYDFLRNEQ